MEIQNKTPTDINQLKLNILNRSASFKKNRNEGSSVLSGTQGQPMEDTGHKSTRSGFGKNNFEHNERDISYGDDKYTANSNGMKKPASPLEARSEKTTDLGNASASKNNINMNLQARVLAFHEQRQSLKNSSSMKKHSIMDPEKQQLNIKTQSPTGERQKDQGSRKSSYTKNEIYDESPTAEKKASLGNSSPVIPSVEVVNKPLPPLPQPKHNTKEESSASLALGAKNVERKLQKMNMSSNRNRHFLKVPTRKKIIDDETSSVSSIVTTDSESDFDYTGPPRNGDVISETRNKTKLNSLDGESDFKKVTVTQSLSGERALSNDPSAFSGKVLGQKTYSITRNTGPPSQIKRESKPLSPLKVTSFGTISDPIAAVSVGQGNGEMNPRRKAPPVPTGLQLPTHQSLNASRGNVHENLEIPKSTNTNHQKIKMGLSARRGLNLDISKIHQTPTTSTPPIQATIPMKIPTHISKSSIDLNNTASTDSLSSSDSNKSTKNISGNWSSLSNNNRTSQLYGNANGNSQNTNTHGTDSVSSLNNAINSGGVGSIFANFSKYVNIKNGSLNFAGKLSLSSDGINFSNGSSFSITFDELEYIGELGSGNYGNVSKVLHKPTQIIMAMKEVRLELDESKFRQILMELDVLHKCSSSYIVDFYGAFFVEGAVYMCMECMDGGSLDKLYASKGACDSEGEPLGVPESILAKIAEAVISGLKVLKDDHNIIHRDVKPTNILCSAKEGTVKLCDFGVSGNLVASLAKTNIGCQSYMAPERIKSFNPDAATYTVHSDVWSLGLTLLEVALGKYPYPPETFGNIFSQLSAIVDGKPPSLPKEKFSVEAQDFINCCLEKKPERRPNYGDLLEHPWLLKYRDEDVDMMGFFTERLETIKKWEQEHNPQPEDPNTNTAENSVVNTSVSSECNSIPALHKGGWMSQ